MTGTEKFREGFGRICRLGKRVWSYSRESRRETVLWQLAAVLASYPEEEEMVDNLSAILGKHLHSPGVFIAMPGEGNTLHLHALKSMNPFHTWVWDKIAVSAMGGRDWSQWRVRLDDPDNLLTRSFRERAVLTETSPGMLLVGGEPGINLARLNRVYRWHLHPVQGGVVLPLIYEEKVLGVLAVLGYRQLTVVPQQDLEFLQSAARLVALALVNARMYRRTQRDKLEIEAKLARIKRLRFQAVQFEEQALLGKMAGTVAHDLNNPLAAILGFSQLMRKDCQLDPKLLRDLESIEACVLRCRRITDAMLDFSRMSREEKTKVSINLLVTHVLDLVRNHLQLADISLEMNFTVADCRVLVHRRRLEQIILGMLNYVERRIAGIGQILIETRKTGEGKVQVCFRNRKGAFPADLLYRALQESMIPKSEEQAAGQEIDLGIACLIAREYGGEIRVEQAPEGAMVVLELPLAQ